jgi:hypothetical protein
VVRGAAVLVLVASLSSVARADDRTRAAEHFALAQSAEKRKDWRAAIDEYEQAYQLAPHPSVLYNIALNHERLRAWRTAAGYFLRYLDGDPDAKDGAEVLARVRGLRERPSRVEVTTRPGAIIIYDGTRIGPSPIALTVPGGEKVAIAVEHEGQRSGTRQVTPEYGETLKLWMDVDTTPGMLEVHTDVPGAEVRLDGEVLGHTPFSGQVASGKHQLLITLQGYRAVQRSVTVPARGSEQIRTRLEPIPGALPAVVTQDERPAGGHKLVSAGAYGYHSNSQGMRLTYSFGYRTPGNHFEISLLTGLFGEIQGVGAESRIFFTSGKIRPFARGAAIYGWHAYADSATALEAGGGILLATAPAAYAARAIGIDYFVEVMGHRRAVDNAEEFETDDADGTSIAVVVGLGGRFGN